MSDKSKGIVLCTLDIIIVFLICSLFLIVPAVKSINHILDTKELTKEEKSSLINEVNDEYSKKLESLNNKYNDKDNSINLKYDPLISEVNDKYDNLIKETKLKFEDEKVSLNEELSTKKSETNKEFMKNGFSKKYYSLNDEVTSLQSKLNDLDKELSSEVSKLESNKKSEVTPYVINKNSLLRENSINKEKELSSLEVSKNKEIDSINKDDNKSVKIGIQVLKIVLAVVITLIPVFYIIKVYNKLTKLSNDIEESYSKVLIYLKKRSDLIPNIVSVVKGYSSHEKNTLKDVVSARNKVVKSSNKDEEIKNNEILDSKLSSIFILNEEYPELKSDKSFNKLIEELKNIEDSISIARDEYNSCVLKYMNVTEVFPSNLVSNVFSFKKESFYKSEVVENVKVGDML